MMFEWVTEEVIVSMIGHLMLIAIGFLMGVVSSR